MDIFVIEIKDADNVHMELLKEFQKKEISDFQKWNAHCFSYLMVDRVLREFYQIEEKDREVVFDGNKPVLKSGVKHFSISHSGRFAALAFSDYNCGIDIEEIKLREFEKISKRMGFDCQTLEDFYKAWTKYEADYKLSVPSQVTKYYCVENYAMTVSSVNVKEEFNIYLDTGN